MTLEKNDYTEIDVDIYGISYIFLQPINPRSCLNPIHWLAENDSIAQLGHHFLKCEYNWSIIEYG